MTDESLFHLIDHTEVLGERAVLRNLNLKVETGEKVALLGPSGAGKTTLLNCLHRLQPVITALQPQGGGLVDNLSVYQNIFMGGLDRISTVAAMWNLVRPLTSHRQQIQALSQVLGLQDKLWHSVDRLSGGQRQRVSIGRALYRQQPIYLGDEPVASLDPVQAQTLLSYLLAKHETAIVSLHQRDLALQNFDRIVVLLDGQVQCDCVASDVTQAQLNGFYQHDEFPQEHNVTMTNQEGWFLRTS